MTTRLVSSFLGAFALSAALFLSAEDAAKKAKAPATARKTPAAPARTKGKLKPVDINSATKEEISFMLGIDVSLAAKIVAGRPYPTKARLLTKNIVTAEVYASIKDRVIARQGPAAK